MSAIIITPDSTRFDIMDALASEVYGIVEPDSMLASDSDIYRWRWYIDELVQQMCEDEFRSACEYICRAHGVDIINQDC